MFDYHSYCEIRLHRIDENDALLSFLRQLQRQFQLAVLLVHHARKDSGGTRPGQALRGSSELHGWGDSNLYMRRRRQQLTLTTEHRAAPSLDPIPVAPKQSEKALALEIQQEPNPSPDPPSSPSANQRVRRALDPIEQPASVQRIRQQCGIRTASVCQALQDLQQNGEVIRAEGGYQLSPVSVSQPLAPRETETGNSITFAWEENRALRGPNPSAYQACTRQKHAG